MKEVAYVRKYAKEVVAVLARLRVDGLRRRKTLTSGVGGAGADGTNTMSFCNTSGFDIASKLLKTRDTLKTTKGSLQQRTSRPPSRNGSPSH